MNAKDQDTEAEEIDGSAFKTRLKKISSLIDRTLNQKHRLEIEEIIKELQEMSIKELKNILQEKGLAVSGNKTTMIERIIKSLQPLNN